MSLPDIQADTSRLGISNVWSANQSLALRRY